MKTFSKLMAIALMAIMTITLTSCEDERSIPVQGSGISDDGVHHNLSPNPPAETEPQSDLNAEAFIKSVSIGYNDEVGEYIYVTVVITNKMDEKMEAWRLAQVGVLDDQGLPHIVLMEELMGDKHEDTSRVIKPGDQDFIIQNFELHDTEFVDVSISVWDNASQNYIVTDFKRFYLTEE